jgi:hypothetical protein
MVLGQRRCLDYNANATNDLYIIVMARGYTDDVEIGYGVTSLQQGNGTGRPCNYETRYTTF